MSPARRHSSCLDDVLGIVDASDWGADHGRRATDWELKGVPVRIDVGPRGLHQGKVTGLARVDWATLGPDGERMLVDHGVSVRCLQREDGSIPETDTGPGLVAITARAY